jgi:nucleotide-binding universal stress UspA family protein
MQTGTHGSFALDGKTVLLAVDDSPASIAATLVANALATEHGAIVHALEVLDTRSAPMPPPLDAMIGIADAVAGPAIHAQRESALRDRIAGVLGTGVQWPCTVKLGSPGSAISHRAAELGATLIVMGLRRHSRVDRAFQDETTLNTIRSAECPVLAVTAETKALPKRALVGMDFGQPSVDAARMMGSLLHADGAMRLAYVHPLMVYREGDGEAVLHEFGLRAGFEQLTQELETGSLSVDHIVLHDEAKQLPAKCLLEAADDWGADIIGAGSVGHSRIERLLMGSVSTDLVRDGRYSVLIDHARQNISLPQRQGSLSEASV